MSLCLRLGQRTFSTTPVSLAVQAKKQKQSYKNKNGSGKKRRGPGSNKYFLDFVSHSNFHKKADITVLEDLAKLSADNGQLPTGELVRYPASTLKKLYKYGSFRKAQFNEIFPEPLTLVTQSTNKLWQFINKTGSSGNRRLIVTGEAGIGKSKALADVQAMSKLETPSVVIPFTNLDSLLDGSSDFAFDQALQKYTQPMATAHLLKKIRTGNEEELKDIKLGAAASFNSALSEDTSLFDFLQLAHTSKWSLAKALDVAVDVLSKQTKYPVLLTVDNLSAFPKTPFTAYRNTSNQPIYFGDFHLATLITDFASGERFFANGAVVMATCSTHGKSNQTIPAVCGLIEPDPYSTIYEFDDVFAKKLVANGGIQHLEIASFSAEETSTLVNFLVDSKVIPEDDGDLARLAQAKYFLSGNGNPLALYKSCVLAYM